MSRRKKRGRPPGVKNGHPRSSAKRDAKIAAVCKSFQENLNVVQVAKQYGITRAWVYCLLKSGGMDFNAARRERAFRRFDRCREKLYEMVLAGCTRTEMALTFSIDGGILEEWLDLLNINYHDDYRKPDGSTRRHPSGCIQIKMGGVWVSRARYVMEQHLGRPLRAHERIMHMNLIKDDDRLENLLLTDRGGVIRHAAKEFKKCGRTWGRSRYG